MIDAEVAAGELRYAVERAKGQNAVCAYVRVDYIEALLREVERPNVVEVMG